MTTASTNHLRFSHLSLTRDTVAINGTAPTWEAPDPLLTQLRNKGYAVALDRDENLAAEQVVFTLATEGTE